MKMNATARRRETFGLRPSLASFASLRNPSVASLSSCSYRLSSCLFVTLALNAPSVTETLRGIAGNRLAMAEPGSLE
jgi:hypothetical protein